MDGDSYKVKCLRRAGRLTLCVQDTTRPYRYVSVEGEVESITPIDWARELEPLVARYLGAADARTYLDGFGGPAGVRGAAGSSATARVAGAAPPARAPWSSACR